MQASKRRRRSEHGALVNVDVIVDTDPETRQEAAMQVVMTIMQDEDEMAIGDLLARANAAGTGASAFSRAELEGALSSLDDDNKVLYHDGLVHRV